MAAGPPVMSPGVALPGAEYFALAPNRSIALGQRRSVGAIANTVSVGASINGQNNVSVNVSSSWGYGDGIYIVRVYMLFVPGDSSGQLVINQARLVLGQPGMASFLELGIPTATLTAPLNPMVVCYDRDALVVQPDMPTFPVNTPLYVDGQISVHNNDGAAAHSFQVQVNCIFHEVKGFVA